MIQLTIKIELQWKTQFTFIIDELNDSINN